ncbi:MAG TPA: DUF559 domain-containing protein [Mycobacteriales bacterium]|nr:DUF559 domain-containing protein [Mycobacteriales bacterium]
MTKAADLASLVGRQAVCRAIDGGQVVHLGRGVVVGRDVLTSAAPAVEHAQRIRSAQLRMGGVAVASHGSAALLHNLARLGRPSGRLRLTRGGGRYRRLDIDARLHVCGLPPEHVTSAYGVSATTIPRTVVDLARQGTFRSGVVVADSALHAGCTKRELSAVTDFCRRWPGVRTAREVVAFADSRAESPLESVSRVFMLERGIPMPELQVRLGDGDRVIGRVDFYWEQWRVVGEADGMLKYDEPGALRREKLRQEALEDTGVIVVRWTWDDIWRQPDRTEARIRRALARGGRTR